MSDEPTTYCPNCGIRLNLHPGGSSDSNSPEAWACDIAEERCKVVERDEIWGVKR